MAALALRKRSTSSSRKGLPLSNTVAWVKIPGAVLIRTWLSKSWIPTRRNASRAVAR